MRDVVTKCTKDFGSNQYKDINQRYLNQFVQVKALSISLGYFLFDTVCDYVIENDRANIAHHLCSAAAVAVGVLQGTVTPFHQSSIILKIQWCIFGQN